MYQKLPGVFRPSFMKMAHLAVSRLNKKKAMENRFTILQLFYFQRSSV
jgi:hypothetical protein